MATLLPIPSSSSPERPSLPATPPLPPSIPLYDSYSIVARGIGSFGLLLQVREGTILTVYGYSRKSALAPSEYTNNDCINPIRKGDMLVGINNLPLHGLDLDIQFSILATAEAFLHRDICLHFYRPVTEQAVHHPPLVAVNETMDTLYTLFSSSQSHEYLYPLLPPLLPPSVDDTGGPSKTKSVATKVRRVQNSSKLVSPHTNEALDDNADEDDDEDDSNDDDNSTHDEDDPEQGSRRKSGGTGRSTSPYGKNGGNRATNKGSHGTGGNKRDSTDGTDGAVKEKRKRRGGRHQLTASGACAWSHEQGQLSFRLLVSACVTLGGVQKTALSHIVHSHYSNLSNWLKGVLSLQPTSRMISLLYRWLEQGCPLPAGVARPRITTVNSSINFSIDTYGSVQNIELFRSMAQSILFQGMQANHVAWTWIDGSRNSMVNLWAFHDQQIEIENKEKEAELLEKAAVAVTNKKQQDKANDHHHSSSSSFASKGGSSSSSSSSSVPPIRSGNDNNLMNEGLGVSSLATNGSSKVSVHAAYANALSSMSSSSATTQNTSTTVQKGGRKKSLPGTTPSMDVASTGGTVGVPSSSVGTVASSSLPASSLPVLPPSLPPVPVPMEKITYSEEKGYRNLVDVPLQKWKDAFVGSTFVPTVMEPIVDVITPPVSSALLSSSSASVLNPSPSTSSNPNGTVTNNISSAVLPPSQSFSSVLHSNPATTGTNLLTMPGLSLISSSLPPSPIFGATTTSAPVSLPSLPEIKVHVNADTRIRCWYGLWEILRTEENRGDNQRSGPILIRQIVGPRGDYEAALADGNALPYYGIGNNILDHIKNHKMLFLEDQKPNEEQPAAVVPPETAITTTATSSSTTQLLPKPKIVTTKGKWTAEHHHASSHSSEGSIPKATVSSSVSYFLDPRLHLANQKQGTVQSYEQLHVLGHHKGDGKMRLGDRYQATLPPLQPKPVRKSEDNPTTTLSSSSSTTTTVTVTAPVSPREVPTDSFALSHPFDDGIPGVTQDTLIWSSSSYELAMIRSAAAAQAAAQAQRAKERELERERRRLAREAALAASNTSNDDEDMGGSSGHSSEADETNENAVSSTTNKRRSSEAETDAIVDEEDELDDEESETVAQRLSGMRRTRRSGPTGKGTGTSSVSGTSTSSGGVRGQAQGLSTSTASPPLNILSSLARYVQFLKWNRLPDPLQEQGDDVLALTILQAYQFSFPRAAEAANAIVNTLNYESNKLNDADITAIRRAQVSTTSRKRNRNTNEGTADNGNNDENSNLSTIPTASSNGTTTTTSNTSNQPLTFGTARMYVASGVTTVILSPTLRPYSRREALEFQEDMLKELSDNPSSSSSSSSESSSVPTGTTNDAHNSTMQDTETATVTNATTTTLSSTSSSSASSSVSDAPTTDLTVPLMGNEICPKHPFAALGWGIRACVLQLPTVTFRTIALASGCTLALLVNFVLGKIGLGASSRTRVLAWIRDNAPLPIKRAMHRAIQTWTAEDVTLDLSSAKAFMNALSSGKVLAEIDPVVAKIVGNDLDDAENNDNANNENGEEGGSNTNADDTGGTTNNRKRVRMDTAALLTSSSSSSSSASTTVTANLLFPSAIGTAASASKNKITTILPKVYYALVETITGNAGRFCWNTLDRTFFEMAIELHGKKLRRTNGEIILAREMIGAKDASTVEAVPPLPNPDGPVPLTLACRYALARTSNPDVADTIAHFYHFWKPNIEYKEWRRRVSFNPLVKEGRVRIGGTYESTLSDYLAALNKETKDEGSTTNTPNNATAGTINTTGGTATVSTTTTPSNAVTATNAVTKGNGPHASIVKTEPSKPGTTTTIHTTTNTVTVPTATNAIGNASPQPAKRGRKPNLPPANATVTTVTASTTTTVTTSSAANTVTSTTVTTSSTSATATGTLPVPPVPERKKPGPKPGSTRTPKVPPTNPSASTATATSSSSSSTTGTVTNSSSSSSSTVPTTTVAVPLKPAGLPRGPKPKPKGDTVTGSTGTTGTATNPAPMTTVMTTTNPPASTTVSSSTAIVPSTAAANQPPKRPGKKPGRKPADYSEENTNDGSTNNNSNAGNSNKQTAKDDDDNDDNDGTGNSAGTTAAALASAASTLNMQYAEIFKQLGLDKDNDDDDDDDYVDEDYFDDDPRNALTKSSSATAKDSEDAAGDATMETQEGDNNGNNNADGTALATTDNADGNAAANGDEEIVEAEGPALDLDDALFDIHVDDCPVCDHGANLVACASCERSYHFTCVGQSTPLASVHSLWTCPTCIYRYAGDREGLRLARAAVHKEIERHAARKRYSFCRRRYFRADCARRTVARIFRELSLPIPPLLTAFLLNWASTPDAEDLVPHTRIGSPLLQSKVLNIECPPEALIEAENSLSIVDNGLRKVLEYLEHRRQYEVKRYEEYQKRQQEITALMATLPVLPSTVPSTTGNETISPATTMLTATHTGTGKKGRPSTGRSSGATVDSTMPNNNPSSTISTAKGTTGRGNRSNPTPPPAHPNVMTANANRTTGNNNGGSSSNNNTKRSRNTGPGSSTATSTHPSNGGTHKHVLSNDPYGSSVGYSSMHYPVGSSSSSSNPNANLYSNYGNNNPMNDMSSSSLPRFTNTMHNPPSFHSASGQRASPNMMMNNNGMNQGPHFRYHDDMAGEDDDDDMEDHGGMHTYDNLHNPNTMNRVYLPSQPPQQVLPSQHSSTTMGYPYGMGPPPMMNTMNMNNPMMYSNPSYGGGMGTMMGMPSMKNNSNNGSNMMMMGMHPNTMHGTGSSSSNNNYHASNIYHHRDDMANDDEEEHHHGGGHTSSNIHPHGGHNIRALGYGSDEGELV